MYIRRCSGEDGRGGCVIMTGFRGRSSCVSFSVLYCGV